MEERLAKYGPNELVEKAGRTPLKIFWEQITATMVLILIALGVPAQTFLTSTSQAMASVMGMVVWKGVGYWMVILLAGLKDIPEAILEAAIVDGAGSARRPRALWVRHGSPRRGCRSTTGRCCTRCLVWRRWAPSPR